MNNLNHQNASANSVLNNISNSNSNISNNYSSNSNLSNTSTNSINFKLLLNSKTLLPNDNEMSKFTLDNLQSLQMMLKNDLNKVDKVSDDLTQHLYNFGNVFILFCFFRFLMRNQLQIDNFIKQN
jgi:hypothetical protein